MSLQNKTKLHCKIKIKTVMFSECTSKKSEEESTVSKVYSVGMLQGNCAFNDTAQLHKDIACCYVTRIYEIYSSVHFKRMRGNR